MDKGNQLWTSLACHVEDQFLPFPVLLAQKFRISTFWV